MEIITATIFAFLIADLAISVSVALVLAPLLTTGLFLAGSIGLQYALRPKPPGDLTLPPPEAGHQAIRQAISPRISGYWINRLAGTYTLYEVKGADSWDVIGFHSGKIGAVISHFLNEDPVELAVDDHVLPQPDGRYGSISGGIKIKTTLGLPVETAFADVVAALPEIWTVDHRGDGVAALMILCPSAAAEFQLETYPNGHPEPSIVANCLAIWDPRDPAQDPDDPDSWNDYPAYDAATTYAAGNRVVFQGGVYYSRIDSNLNDRPDLNQESWCGVGCNPVLQAIDYLTDNDHGRGLDRTTLIDPVLAHLIGEANLCDELMLKKDGSHEPRYVSAGFFSWDNDEVTVMGGIMATCDGWYAEAVDGTLALWVGVYREPTVTLSARHITAYAFVQGKADEQSVDELTLTYTSEPHKFKTVPGASLRNEAAIARKGKARSKSLDLTWVRSHAQARRLQKRAMARETDPAAGTLTTKLYGIKADGERWIRVQFPDYPALADAVVELQPGGNYDLLNTRCGFNFMVVDPATIDAWDPVTEEGDPPPVPEELAGDGLPVPAAVEAFLEGNDVTGVVIVITCDDPERPDLNYRIRYRVKDIGSGVPGAWQYATLTDPPVNGGRVRLSSDPVQTGPLYEATVAFVGGGGSVGEYFDPPIEVDTNTGAPDVPRDLGSSQPALGIPTVRVVWTNPNSPNFYKTVLYRSIITPPDFADAAPLTTQYAAPNSTGTFDNNDAPIGLVPGDYHYWVKAFNASGDGSAAVGPTSQTVV